MIWLILGVGIILRFINLNQSLWLDEGINVLAAKNYSFIDLITQYARADFHPPGWFMILWAWTKIFGYSEIAVRIPSVIFGSLTIWIMYLIGKKIDSVKLGLFAALLLAVSPLHIYYSQEARMYALAALAVSINFLLWIKIIKSERVKLFFLVLSNIFVFLSDYLAYFIFPSQFIFLVIYKRELLKKWIITLVLAVLSGLWWFPTFLGQFNVGSIASSNLPTWKFVVGGFDFKTIPLTFVKFIIGRISLDNKILYGSVMVPAASMYAFILYKGYKNLDSLNKKLLVIWIVVPIVLATIISIFIPIYSYFRVLFVLPIFILLLSLGILSLKRNLSNIAFVLVFLISVFSSLVYLLNPNFHREDWKGLVNFLAKEKSSVVLYESSGTLPPFDYYSKGTLNAKGALKDFPAKSISDVYDLNNLIGEDKNVFLVEYLVDISDSNRFVQKRLSELNYKQDKIYDFRGVGFVYHYVAK